MRRLMRNITERLARIIDYIRPRKRAYQLAFGSPAGQDVLRDLAVFCRANDSAAVPGDDARTYILVGRREVFLRIQQHLNLSSEQLALLFSGQTLKPEEVQT